MYSCNQSPTITGHVEQLRMLRLFTTRTMCSDALLGSRGLPSEGCLWCRPWTHNHQTQALQQTDISV